MSRVLAILTLIVLVASSCSGDASEDSDTHTTAMTAQSTMTTAQAATTTTAPAATSTTLAPISYPGGATYVTGHITDFAISAGNVTTNADGTTQGRDGTIDYTLVSNDPRAAGTVTGTWHSDRWGTPANAAIIQWGEATITNENGTWEGSYNGFWTSSVGDVITRWWQGTGDYEGLTFYMAATGFSDWEWVGLIYPGDPPPQP